MTTRVSIEQNYLSPVEFRFVIQRLPYTTFFVQSASIPGISASPAMSPTPFRDQYYTPGKMEYQDFSLEFAVDEYMKNYQEIHDWMVGISFPDEFKQFKDQRDSEFGLYSDATLVVMTNGKNPNIQIKFKDIFPIDLSSIQMDTKSPDMVYSTAQMTFKTNGYTIDPLDNP